MVFLKNEKRHVKEKCKLSLSNLGNHGENVLFSMDFFSIYVLTELNNTVMANPTLQIFPINQSR